MILTLIYSFSAKAQVNFGHTYILLENHSRTYDKPALSIVFSCDSLNINILNTYAVSYKVDRCDYLSIEKAIETSDYVRQIDTSEVGYYLFTVVNNNKKRTYKAINKNDVSKVFDSIEKQLTNKNVYNRIRGHFRDIIGLLK